MDSERTVMDENWAIGFASDRLKWLAAQLDLTQKEIAKRVGVSAVVINRIFKNPDRSSVATLRKIAKAMGVKLTELIHD
jgi:transcriptional regulator with XRE-family HTH domain